MTVLPRRSPRPNDQHQSGPRAMTWCALLVAVATFLPGSARADDAVPPAPAARGDADRLVLKDGRTLVGGVVAETGESVTFRSGGTTRLYPMADVERIERGAAAPPAGSTPDTAAPSAPPAPSAGGAPTPPAPTKKDLGAKKIKALTDAARTWIRELGVRAESEDEQVRRSIAAALRALGPVAEPAIRDAAVATATPSARAFLESVATDLGNGRGDGKRSAKQAPAPSEDTPAPMAPGPDAAAPESPAAPEAGAGAPMDTPPSPAPAAPGRAGARPGRAALDRLTADLELRDDQKLKMQELLGALERGQFAMLREKRQGALSAAQAAERVESLRTSSVASARSFLDPVQMDLFEEHAQRYFDGMLLRLGGEGVPGEGAPQSPPRAPK